MGNAAASKAVEGNLLGVQLPSPAPSLYQMWNSTFEWNNDLAYAIGLIASDQEHQ